MKVRIGKDRGSGATLMTVSSARGEAPDVSHAQMFASGGASLLPYRCDMTERDVTYTYNVTGCTSLHDVMRQPMTDAVYANVLVAVNTVMHLCETSGLALETVLWDPKQVFVAPNGAVYLALAPMLGLGTTKHTPVALIGLMGEERRVKPASARCEWLQQSVRAFTQQLPVFNGVQFAAFLESIGLLSSAMPDATVAGETVGGETIGGETIGGATIASTQTDATVAGSTIMSAYSASAHSAGLAGESGSAALPVQGSAAQSGPGGMQSETVSGAAAGPSATGGTGGTGISSGVSGMQGQGTHGAITQHEDEGSRGLTADEGRRYATPSPFQQENGGRSVSPLQRLHGIGPEPIIKLEPLAAQPARVSGADDEEEDGTVLSHLGPTAPRITAQPQHDAAIPDSLHGAVQSAGVVQSTQPSQPTQPTETAKTTEPTQAQPAAQSERQPKATAPAEPEAQPVQTGGIENGPVASSEPQAGESEPVSESNHAIETHAMTEAMPAPEAMPLSEPSATQPVVAPEPAVLADSVVDAETRSVAGPQPVAGPQSVVEPQPVAGPQPVVEPQPVPRDAAARPVPSIGVQTAAGPIRQAQPTPAASPAARIPVQPGPQPVVQPVVRPVMSLPVQTMTESEAQADDGEGETRIFGAASQTGFVVTRLRDGRRLNATGAIAHKATIGRSKTADLHMGGNTNVSRVHATIEMLPDGRFCITDNNSANGTSVRGREVAPGGTEFLNSGEDFELADDTFIIELL